MTGKQITTIKYLVLKIKIEMREKGLSINDISELTGYIVPQIEILLYTYDYTYIYGFKKLMNICIDLKILNIFFDESDIANLSYGDL